MKKYIILVIITLTSIGTSFYLYKGNNKLKEENEKLYKQFEKNKLIDVTGEINLTEIKSQNKELKSELKKLYNQEKYHEETYKKILQEKELSNKNIEENITKLSNQVTNLESSKKNLSNQQNILNTKYNNLKRQTTSYSVNSNNSYNFPLINQYPNYPTGCESVALTMLLRYYGINVSPNNIINNLQKESLPYYENGVRYGGNPEVGFIGNPYSSSSYGVYERPIAAVANIYKSGIQIKNNFSFQEVLNLVRSNKPVLAWTSMNLSLPYLSDSWTYKPTMEKIQWKANEHAVVIIGVQGNNVIIADPIGGAIKSFSISLFESRYNYYGRKALYYL